MSYPVIGLNPALTHATAQYALGTVGTDRLGREFVYVQATETVAQYDCCIIHGGFTMEPITADLAVHDTGAGKICGVAIVAFADNEYGWLARKGTGSDIKVNLVGVADDFQPLGPTTTAGKLDNQDAGSATAPRVEGIVITTASGGAEAEICILDYPITLTDYPA